MPANEVRAILEQLGWPQTVAAYRLGVSARMMRRYVAPGSHMPPTVAQLLRSLAASAPKTDPIDAETGLRRRKWREHQQEFRARRKDANVSHANQGE